MAQATNTPSVHFGNNNTDCGNTIWSNNNIFSQSDEDAQILLWLSPLDPNYRHQSVRCARFEGVGGWLLETKEFQEWRGGKGGPEKAVLFCSGNPGVGKTYLSSLVIDSLCDQARERDIAVAGFYCDFLAQQEQTIPHVIGAILRQLVIRERIPYYIRRAFEEGKLNIGSRRLVVPDLMGMLKMVIASLPQFFICIDALDEYLPKHLPELLMLLQEIVQECPRARIFLTGRPQVTGAIRRHFTKTVVIPFNPNMDDTRNYLEMRLDRDDEPDAMDNALRTDIMKIIIEKMSDIFLLVSLSIDAILEEVTIHRRRNKLNGVAQGEGPSDVYSSTLSRLKAQKGSRSRLGMEVLLWVSHSERPLRAEELCHALGVEMGSADFNPSHIPSLQTLLVCCLGLVTVQASSSTVQLVHPTLREYLFNNQNLFHNPHSTIAEVCLTYLNFESRWDRTSAPDSVPPTMPFEEYASSYWSKHAQKGMAEKVKELALRLLNRQATRFGGQFLS